MKFTQGIRDFLYKDVMNKNESKKAAVILRFTAIIMCCYFALVLMLYLIACGKVLLCAVPCLLLIGIAFYDTYQDHTRRVIIIANIIIVFWILYMVYMFGWDCGVQHFLFSLIILDFTTSLSNFRIKILYTFLLVTLRMILFWYTWNYTPAEIMTTGLHIAFQGLNTVAVCCMMVVMLLLYTKDSRRMEEKLILYNENLKKLASKDPLTGLKNRRSVLEYLEEKAELYKNGKYNALSVAIADIDYFKKVNDIYGHECGDTVLKKLGMVFEEHMNGIGIVGRWGGEEFLFVFKDRNGDEAYTELLKLQCAIKKLDFSYNGEQLTITLTYGLTEYDSNKQLDMIIKEADEKLYMGKKAGRNRIVY